MSTAATTTQGAQLTPTASIEAAVFNLEALAVQEDEDDVFTGQMEFDLGEMSHWRYGRAHLTGKLGLLDRPTNYKPAFAAEEAEATKTLATWCEDHDYFPPAATLTVPVAYVGRLARGGSLNSPLRLALIANTLVPLLCDDAEEKTSIITRHAGPGQSAAVSQISSIYMDVLEGKYETLEDVPLLPLPILQPIMTLGWFAYEQIRKGGKGPSLPRILREEMLASFRGFVTLTDFKFVNGCSDVVYASLRRDDACFLILQEWLAWDGGLELGEDLRGNGAFKILRERYGTVCGLYNDLIGIRKEMEEKDPTNLILRKVIKGGLSLEGATKEVVNLINEGLKDIGLCARKLEEEFPEEEGLQEYIANVRYASDALFHLHTSNIQRRYGKELAEFKCALKYREEAREGGSG